MGGRFLAASCNAASIFLVVALCLVFVPNIAFAKDDPFPGTPEDVTSKVTIGKINATITENAIEKPFITEGVIDPSVTVNVGDYLTFQIFWNINAENIAGIHAGDYFDFLLPSEYFTFTSLTGGIVKAGNVTIGTLELIVDSTGARLRVTLNDDGANALELKDGWVRATGKASQTKDESTEITIGNSKLPSFPIDPNGNPGNNTGTTTYPWPNPQPLSKNGFKASGLNNVNWTISVNSEVYAAAYNGGTIEQKRNVVITDTLESGMVLNSVTFSSPYYYAHTDGKISTTIAYDPPLPTDAITKITEHPDEEYEAFYTRVLNEPGPSYGIFQKKRLVISLKDFPDSLTMAYTYAEFQTKADAELISGKLSRSQYDNFTAAYRRLYNNQTSAQLLGLRLMIHTTVYGEERTLTNEAQMIWNDSDHQSSSTQLKFQTISGGASMGDPGSVIIKKFETGSNNKLDGVVFKLEKWKGSAGGYVPYTTMDGVTEATTLNGEALFENLEYGLYRVVEAKPLEGYLDEVIFKDGVDTFTIDGTESGAIFITAYNTPTSPEGPKEPGSPEEPKGPKDPKDPKEPFSPAPPDAPDTPEEPKEPTPLPRSFHPQTGDVTFWPIGIAGTASALALIALALGYRRSKA